MKQIHNTYFLPPWEYSLSYLNKNTGHIYCATNICGGVIFQAHFV